MARSRTFKSQKHGASDEELSTKLAAYMRDASWLVGQEEEEERSGEPGTRLIRCVFGYKNPRHLSALQKSYPDGRNIETVSDVAATIKRCSDENTRTGKFHLHRDVPKFERKRNDEMNATLMACRDAKSYREAMEIIEKKDRLFYILHESKFSAYFTKHFAECDRPLYAPEDFTIPLVEFPPNKTLIFVGPTRIGKTQFALAHFHRPIIIRGKEDWKRFKEGHTDGVVLDDIAFRRWLPETLLHTMERETGYTQDVKFTSVRVPAYLKKIVCINDMKAF